MLGLDGLFLEVLARPSSQSASARAASASAVALLRLGRLQGRDLRLQALQLEPLHLGGICGPPLGLALRIAARSASIRSASCRSASRRCSSIRSSRRRRRSRRSASSSAASRSVSARGRFDPLELATGGVGLLSLSPLGCPPGFLDAFRLPSFRLAPGLLEPLLLQPVRLAPFRGQPVSRVALQLGLQRRHVRGLPVRDRIGGLRSQGLPSDRAAAARRPSKLAGRLPLRRGSGCQLLATRSASSERSSARRSRTRSPSDPASCTRAVSSLVARPPRRSISCRRVTRPRSTSPTTSSRSARSR